MASTNDKKRFKISKGWKWVIGVFTAIILILGGIAVYVNLHWRPIISKRLKDAVQASSKGLYSLDFKDLSLNIFTGNVAISKLVIKPDYKVYETLRRQNVAPKRIYEVEFYDLLLNRIHLWELYREKKLEIKSIVIEKPVISVIYRDIIMKGDSIKDNRTFYQRISKTLKMVKIGSVALADADFKYIDRTEKTSTQRGFKNLSVKITDILVDSLADKDKSRFHYCKDIFASLKNHQFTTKDGLYTIKVGDVTSSVAGGYLYIKRLKVIPKLPEMQFSRQYKFQHDRYDMNFNEIILNHIDFQKLDQDKKLRASKLMIDGGNVNIFMNRELPPVTFDKGRNYPHVVLKRLKINMYIDTVQIKNTRIAYSEFNPKSQRKGTLVFNRFNGDIYHVTNDSVSIRQNHWMKAYVSAWLMNKGHMNVNINFDLAAANAAFNFNGTMGAMDMRDLNTVSRGLSMVEIQSGSIQKAQFDVSANWRNSTGTFKLYYKDLKVNILKKDEDNNKLEKRGFLSTIANGLIVNNENPGKDGKLRIGKADATRINSGSFFNLMWKSVFAGLKESVGVTLDDVSTVQVKPDGKDIRKEERKKRREEKKRERQENKK